MSFEEVLVPLDSPTGVTEDDLELLLVAALVDQDGGRRVAQVVEPLPQSVPKQQATRARQEIGLADSLITAHGDTCSADGWAELARQATELGNGALRDQRARGAANRQNFVGQQSSPELDGVLAARPRTDLVGQSIRLPGPMSQLWRET